MVDPIALKILRFEFVYSRKKFLYALRTPSLRFSDVSSNVQNMFTFAHGAFCKYATAIAKIQVDGWPAL